METFQNNLSSKTIPTKQNIEDQLFRISVERIELVFLSVKSVKSIVQQRLG
jgi:hypothetical protein